MYLPTMHTKFSLCRLLGFLCADQPIIIFKRLTPITSACHIRSLREGLLQVPSTSELHLVSWHWAFSPTMSALWDILPKSVGYASLDVLEVSQDLLCHWVCVCPNVLESCLDHCITEMDILILSFCEVCRFVFNI